MRRGRLPRSARMSSAIENGRVARSMGVLSLRVRKLRVAEDEREDPGRILPRNHSREVRVVRETPILGTMDVSPRLILVIEIRRRTIPEVCEKETPRKWDVERPYTRPGAHDPRVHITVSFLV